jgi:putative protease
VKSHTNVELTDPMGYVFPVATDSDCRNRLLHSRPIDGSEFVPELWSKGIRGFRLLFNIPGDPVAEVTSAFRSLIDACATGTADPQVVRGVVGSEFTRGHFERAV